MTMVTDPERVAVLFMQSQTYFGADSMIHSLIMQGLDRSRFEVHAAVNPGTRWDPSHALPKLRRIPGVRVRPTNFATSINFRSWREKIRDTLLVGPKSVLSMAGLVIYARKHQIQIVHCTEKPRDAFYGYLLARAIGARCIVHVHVGVNHEWMSRFTQFAMRKASGLIGVSGYVKQTAIDAGYQPERVFAILNSLDASTWNDSVDGRPVRDEFGLSPSTKVLSIISRVCPWKGHRELLEALAKVAPEYPDFRLLLVGEDDIRATPGNVSFTAELRKLVIELGIEEHVIFTGYRSDIAAIMAASDIYAMPSWEEPFGVVYLEAQAMQVPVIAYRGVGGGGTEEAVDDGRAGLLSEPYDIDELAANILRLMRNDYERAEMGAYGRRRVLEYYTPQRIAADTAAVYDKVLAGPR